MAEIVFLRCNDAKSKAINSIVVICTAETCRLIGVEDAKKKNLLRALSCFRHKSLALGCDGTHARQAKDHIGPTPEACEMQQTVYCCRLLQL